MSGVVAAYMADSPLLFWTCGEASGNLVDQVASEVAVATGGPTYGATGFASYDPITAVTSSSTSGFQWTDDGTVDALGDGPWTVEACVRRAATGGSSPRILVTKGTAFSLLFYGDKFSLEPDTSPSHEESGLTDDGLAHHFAVTRAGGAGSTIIRKDGVIVTRVVNDSLTYAANDVAIGIGVYYTSAFGLEGTVGLVAIYGSVLSQAQLDAHRRALLAPTGNDLGVSRVHHGLV